MAGIQYVVNAIDGASTTFSKIARSADALNAQLADLSKQNATPSVELQDKIFQTKVTSAKASIAELSKRIAHPAAELQDKMFKLGIADAQVKLDRLSAKVAKPEIELKGLHSAELGILKVGAMLDKLDGRKAEVTVDVNRRGGLLSRLGGRGGGGGGLLGGLLGGGGAAKAAGSAAGLAPPSLQALGIGAGAVAGAALAPAAIPTLGGGILGILGPLLAFPKMIAKDFKDMGAAFRSVLAPLRPLFQSVFGGLAGFVKSIGPGLRNMFKASIPFLAAFVKDLEQAARTLLPVFTASLRQMTPFLPMISQGLLAIVQGLAGMIKAMGPGGMKAAAQIFVALCKAMEGILIAVGYAANFMAEMFRDVGLKIRQRVADWHRTFDDFRHRTAVVFDGVRHDIAHIWDQIYSNSIGAVIRLVTGIHAKVASFRHDTANVFDGVRHDIAHIWDLIWNNTISRIERGLHDVAHDWDVMRHDTASKFDAIRHDIAHAWDVIWQNTVSRVQRGITDVAHDWDVMRHSIAARFDTIRHDIASAWDTIWNNTVSRVQRGITDVVGWFRGIPSRLLGALRGVGTAMYNEGHLILTELWNGLKSVASSIGRWFTNFGHTIISIVKKVLGVFSPSSVFYDIGRNLMIGLRNGVQDHVHHAVNAARAAAGAVGAQGGPTSASAAQAQAYARSRLGAYGWGASQMAPLIALWNQESGWNRFARNPSSGAYGIPQALPPSKMGAAANPPTSSAAAQINWGLSYIKGRYGSPAGAEAHERAFNWYGSGLRDGLFARPTIIGVGERGPERVNIEPVSSGRRQPASVSLTQNGDVYIRDPVDVPKIVSQLSFKVIAASMG